MFCYSRLAIVSLQAVTRNRPVSNSRHLANVPDGNAASLWGAQFQNVSVMLTFRRKQEFAISPLLFLRNRTNPEHSRFDVGPLPNQSRREHQRHRRQKSFVPVSVAVQAEPIQPPSTCRFPLNTALSISLRMENEQAGAGRDG